MDLGHSLEKRGPGISIDFFLLGLKREQSRFLHICFLYKSEIILAFKTLEENMVTFQLLFLGEYVLNSHSFGLILAPPVISIVTLCVSFSLSKLWCFDP